ncbi:hypothetical protein [Pseudanabaena sp. UWO311]|nr:hypothetical protein [Pseudanabaena sp. UWO311]
MILRFRRSGLWVVNGDRCLMWGKGDRVLGVGGDRCLILRFRRSGLW